MCFHLWKRKLNWNYFLEILRSPLNFPGRECSLCESTSHVTKELYVCVYIYVCVCDCVCARVHACVHVGMSLSVNVYVCGVCVCVCVWCPTLYNPDTQG